MKKTGYIVSFAAGALVAVGAAMVYSRWDGVAELASSAVRKAKGLAGKKEEAKKEEGKSTTPYCAVPEGADICYPEK